MVVVVTNPRTTCFHRYPEVAYVVVRDLPNFFALQSGWWFAAAASSTVLEVVLPRLLESSLEALMVGQL